MGMSLGGRVLAQSHLFTFSPKKAGIITRARPAGDMNADGFDDILFNGPSDPPLGDLVQVFSGRDGRFLWSLKPKNGNVQDLIGAGDLDRDGYADIVIAAFNTVLKRNELWYHSGKTGKRFRTVPLKYFSGWANLARGGDVNRDGYPDLLVGLPNTPGRAAVVSGKDGSVIHDLKPPASTVKWFAYQVASAGDPDEDGYADFLVGSSSSVGGGVLAALLYSGKTGRIMTTFATTKKRLVGLSIHAMDDINKDGRRDYAITGREFQPPYGLFIEIRSGAKRDKNKVLLTLREFNPSQSAVDMEVAMLGDINQDGLPDLAVGFVQYTVGGRGGWIEFRSGKDGSFLRLLKAPVQNLLLANKIGSLGDVNGDGMPDIYSQTSGAVISPTPKLDIYVLSGAPMDLWSDTHRVSLSKQGKQVLQLDAGPKHAGSSYFVLGSLSGIKPGLKLGGLTLPLQPDLYFLLAASSPNSAMFQGSLGVLDSKGRATCTITALKGLPAAWVGARADHAYILFKNGRFTKTSHWTPLLFEK